MALTGFPNHLLRIHTSYFLSHLPSYAYHLLDYIHSQSSHYALGLFLNTLLIMQAVREKIYVEPIITRKCHLLVVVFRTQLVI